MALSNGTTQTHSENPPIPKSWCVTDAKVINHIYKWTVNNFTLCAPDINEDLCSLSFSADDDVYECKWRLELIANEKNKEYFGIFLTLMSCNNNKAKVRANFKCFIINPTSEETKVDVVGGPSKLPHTYVKDECWGYPNFVKKEYLLNKTNNLLPNNKLTLLCKLSIVCDKNSTSGPNKVNFNTPACQLPKDLGDLFDSERLSDVTLAVGSKEFKAHKAILSARSPVFAAMFEHDMEENKNNRVNITDMDHETLRELLHFIYTGRAANVDKIAARLLSASDKYTLEPLKVMCEEALYKDLTVENAAESLILADLYSADQLKASIIKFISKNHARAVMETTGWQLVTSSYQHLLVELFRSLAIQQSDTTCTEIN